MSVWGPEELCGVGRGRVAVLKEKQVCVAMPTFIVNTCHM